VNGLEMYHEVHGTGQPLVLLHGGLLTIDLSFGAVLPALAATRQVIAVEPHGHGHTAVSEGQSISQTKKSAISFRSTSSSSGHTVSTVL
jgi:pimeloyl-ACP methyl ester carboxylesterase